MEIVDRGDGQGYDGQVRCDIQDCLGQSNILQTLSGPRFEGITRRPSDDA